MTISVGKPPQCSSAGCQAFESCPIARAEGTGEGQLPPLRKVRLPTGADAFHQGTPQTGIVVLCAGTARLIRLLESGRHALLRVCGPGDLLSVPAATHSYSCRVDRDGWVAVLESVAAASHMVTSPAFAVALVEETSRQLAYYVRRIGILAAPGARRRLAGVLTHLAEEWEGDPETECRLAVSARDLASMAACCRQTASAWLRGMEREGVIARQRGVLSVLRPEALAERRSLSG